MEISVLLYKVTLYLLFCLARSIKIHLKNIQRTFAVALRVEKSVKLFLKPSVKFDGLVNVFNLALICDSRFEFRASFFPGTKPTWE